LLHGGESGFRAWTNDSGVAHYAEPGLVLVLPDGNDPYYTNSDSRPTDRYEDYLVQDLIKDVETRFPVSADRRQRAIVGISIGGFAAVKLALKYPDLFFSQEDFSSALDVPSRPLAMKRWGQWRHHRSIFALGDGQHQRNNGPLLLARIADPVRSPYYF
jgi:putative tributyrin esterase